jgi:hypothetical protein
MMNCALRLTGAQHRKLKAHLFSGDGKEAVALVLCGRLETGNRQVLTAREIHPVPYAECHGRTPDRVCWSTSLLPKLLDKAAQEKLSLLKIHSHPGGYAQFSDYDDAADRELFSAVCCWLGEDRCHASTVMLPDGRMFGRMIQSDWQFTPLSLITIVGDDLHYWFADELAGPRIALPEFTRRHAQAFGAGTTQTLRQLSVAVVGCSGTGSPVIEQLVRLGVGRLVLIDPDRVEEKNLNRILNTTLGDAHASRFKVDVLAEAISKVGLATEVLPLAHNLYWPAVVKAVAECDAVFGCMDSVDGRHLLNRLATYYLVPYFDVGVKLEADREGGLNQICGTVHYLQPDGSSLFSRGVYSLEQLRAADLKRVDPAAYQEQLRSKYIVGVAEERPAVASVNMLFASLAVNELLLRLHPCRDDGNAPYASLCFSLTQGAIYQEADGQPCELLAHHAGRGDVMPLLGLPLLSEGLARSAQCNG